MSGRVMGMVCLNASHGFGTTAYTDPAEGMIGILFTQRMMGFARTAEGIHRLLDAGV